MIFDTVLISSKDRVGGNKSQLTIKINGSINSKEFQLKHAQFLNSFYTFRAQTVIFNNGVASPVVLNGKYTATSLAAFILASLPAGYTSVYNPSTERLTFTNAAPFTITFPDIYTARAFGFSTLVGLVVGPALSITTTDPPEMDRYKTILIYFNELGSNSTNSSPSSFSYLIPVNALPLDTASTTSAPQIFYNKFHFDQQIFSTTNTEQKSFAITIHGDDGVIVPSTEMNEWSLILATDPRFKNPLGYDTGKNLTGPML